MNWGIPDVAMKTLESYGIELVMNEKVTQYSEATGIVTLASGKTLQCDYYVPPCLGSGNCKFLPAASQDGNGYAKVIFTFSFSRLPSPRPCHMCPPRGLTRTFVPFVYWPRGRWRSFSSAPRWTTSSA